MLKAAYPNTGRLSYFMRALLRMESALMKIEQRLAGLEAGQVRLAVAMEKQGEYMTKLATILETQSQTIDKAITLLRPPESANPPADSPTKGDVPPGYS